MGEPEGISVNDRVATYLRAVLRSEMKCEMSLVHIPWMDSCNVPQELM